VEPLKVREEVELDDLPFWTVTELIEHSARVDTAGTGLAPVISGSADRLSLRPPHGTDRGEELRDRSLA
jgi:hypothetical protein